MDWFPEMCKVHKVIKWTLIIIRILILSDLIFMEKQLIRFKEYHHTWDGCTPHFDVTNLYACCPAHNNNVFAGKVSVI